MTDRLVDREYLTEVQYASDANLSARQAIYRFQVPPSPPSAWALARAELAGDERVLDVGCGNGIHLAALARQGHRGAVVGMDLSAGMLAAARTRSPAALLVGDAQSLPFPDVSFDCVLAMHMLYHVPDRDRAIAELRRLTRRGGRVLAVTNSNQHLQELNDLIAAVVHDVTGRDATSVRAYLRFSSESGGAELRRHFASVERHDAQSELVVTEVEPIVAYVASMGSVATFASDAAPPVLREVERRTRAVIERDGAFRIRTAVGCFVCA